MGQKANRSPRSEKNTPGSKAPSVLRHLCQWWGGEDIDPESGLHHIDHALTQLMILRIQTMEGQVADDRWRTKDV